ncbi:MAG: tRNA (adenosine(37)-N6)-threonylcarbamoyltransferase complex dimerization subunit type 1 TsaB [Methylococcales bacterium]|nr:tRNA (adenosine(37)-N6)-threonylcarbamoyltransferase complex dimerization subunit type 1 TsaB [Methylococcales bacterium]MDP3838709.1 tRNA (adenosine(37)-N6)-threonylcarbamoyltransferase complex dimerization subunit type 1 TsaB [Methylococcales bacterium]
MKLLAVETATEACSAALYVDGAISERFELAPRHHTKLILPMIDELMREAGLKPSELDALAFGCGPGSFTGIRIATGVIQGIALGADLPVVCVSTLAAMAQELFDRTNNTLAFTAIDARMDEIFWGVYQRDALGFAELIGNESVTPAALVECAVADAGVGIGSGWGVYADVLMERLAGRVRHYESDNLPRAALIARLGVRGFEQGLAVPVELATPVYLRDKVAKTEAERRLGVQ